MDAGSRARELAVEHGLHVVRVTLRGEGLDDLGTRKREKLIEEAAAEVRAVIDAEGWPVWWAEDDADAALFVLDGIPVELKTALLGLEDTHVLGGWFNLDLVTELAPDEVGAWHATPMRPQPRPLRTVAELEEALAGYDWS